LHLVGILFPHINDDARSKSHQIYKYPSSESRVVPMRTDRRTDEHTDMTQLIVTSRYRVNAP